jgi:hypothetical protein
LEARPALILAIVLSSFFLHVFIQLGSSAASMQKFTLAHLAQNHDVGELLADPLGRGLVAYFTHN